MDKEYLIRKWLAEELTDPELEAFKKLDDYHMHTKILEGAQYFRASDVSEIADVDEIYAKMNYPFETVSKKRNWYQPLFKIAAALVVLIGITFFFFTNSDSAFKTMASEKRSFELPDQSEVVINSKSEIFFNENTWNDKREVNLDGEAFFKVKKGSAFDVITKDGKVTVLGTQFNVKNRDNYFEVKCFEGLVKVKTLKHDQNLPAGSALKIIDGKITFETIDLNRPQWLSNISSFKSIPFYEVINEFERQYGVRIIVKDVDTKRLFTGGFIHNDMEDGLKSITLPLDLTYTIETSNNIILRTKE
ncbi:FecR family protein [Aquimarina rubra]|uniref:FecR family protein n=1 Tax=Aquimarina rubra TaxID=1920033 RepID=A0ABW5LKW6_9FLAO